MKDGDDLLPNVPHSAKPSPEAEVLNAVFELLSEGRPTALVVKPNSKGAKAEFAVPIPRKPGMQDVTFLSGDPAKLTGLRSLKPIVVLTPAQISVAQTKFGDSYPMRIDIVIAAGGQRCFIEWSEGWRGGTIEGTRKDGPWVLTEISSWISQGQVVSDPLAAEIFGPAVVPAPARKQVYCWRVSAWSNAT